MLTPWKESYDQPRQHIKEQRHYFANKGPSSQGYGFSSGHVWMWELDYKESWAPKNWCFWSLSSPLVYKEIQPVHPKGDQSWVFIGRTDAEAETPILWLPDVKSWLIWKDPDAGSDSGQEEKGTTEDKMAGWHHRLDGHEFGWTPGIGDGQGGLMCCDSWGRRESDTTERLNWTDTYIELFYLFTFYCCSLWLQLNFCEGWDFVLPLYLQREDNSWYTAPSQWIIAGCSGEQVRILKCMPSSLSHNFWFIFSGDYIYIYMQYISDVLCISIILLFQ